jgi:hypothetical protein
MPRLIRPAAKVVYVCDDVVGDPETGKVSLLNLWDTVRVAAADAFPYKLPKVCVFAWWRDGLGQVRTRIDIVQASSNDVVRRTDDCVIEFEDRTTSVFAKYKLKGCTFPGPDYYYVELYCEDRFVDDQLIRVAAQEE